MNARLKLGIFLAAIVSVIFIGINCVRHLFGGYNRFSGGPGGYRSAGMMGQGGMMSRDGGFGRHAFMYGPHHEGGFHVFGFLLFLLMAAAIVIFVLRWLRGKSKTSSMQQLIETPFVSSHTPVSTMNGSILDKWEKSIIDQKENEKDGNF